MEMEEGNSRTPAGVRLFCAVLGEGGLYPQRVAESELEETESRRSAEKAALYYDSGALLSV